MIKTKIDKKNQLKVVVKLLRQDIVCLQIQNTSLKQRILENEFEDENDSDQEQSNEDDNSESLAKVHGDLSRNE